MDNFGAMWNGQNWVFQISSDHFGAKRLGENVEWPKLGILIFLDHFSPKRMEKMWNNQSWALQFSGHFGTKKMEKYAEWLKLGIQIFGPLWCKKMGGNVVCTTFGLKSVYNHNFISIWM